METKKVKTRSTADSCFGAPCALPDTGGLYTLRDVLAACEFEKTVNPGVKARVCVKKVAPLVLAKWAQINP